MRDNLRSAGAGHHDRGIPVWPALTIHHPDGTQEETRYLLAKPLQEAQDFPTSQIDAGGRVARPHPAGPTDDRHGPGGGTLSVCI